MNTNIPQYTPPSSDSPPPIPTTKVKGTTPEQETKEEKPAEQPQVRDQKEMAQVITDQSEKMKLSKEKSTETPVTEDRSITTGAPPSIDSQIVTQTLTSSTSS